MYPNFKRVSGAKCLAMGVVRACLVVEKEERRVAEVVAAMVVVAAAAMWWLDGLCVWWWDGCVVFLPLVRLRRGEESGRLECRAGGILSNGCWKRLIYGLG